MKLALFSRDITEKAAKRLVEIIGKPAKETKLAYIITAARTYMPPKPSWLQESENRLREIGFRVDVIDIEEKYKRGFNFKKYFSNKDVVAVSGGNMFYLLYWLYKSGVDKIIKDLIKKDKIVYVGESAGVVCLIKDIKKLAILDKPELAPEKIKEGLGIINFLVIPHWSVEKYQKKSEEIRQFYENKGIKVYPINNQRAIFVVDKKIEKV